MRARDFRSRARAAAIVLLGCTALAACGHGAPSGQVVAVVDGHEVTTAQLNLMLSQLPNEAMRDDHGVQATVAKGLIDETLLMSEAERDGLDKDPTVTREIDRARRTVLANAYVRRFAPSMQVTPAQIETFYNDHPWYFSERRQYVLTDVAVAGGAELDRYLPAFNAPNATLDELVAKLRADRRAVTPKQFPVSADQLPEPMAKALAKMAVHDNYTTRTGEIRHFGRIDSISINPVPLTAVQAKIAPAIWQRRLAEAIRTKVDALRAQRKIEMGTVGKAIFAAAPPSAPVVPAKPANGADSQAVQRGINGL